LNNFEERNCK